MCCSLQLYANHKDTLRRDRRQNRDKWHSRLDEKQRFISGEQPGGDLFSSDLLAFTKMNEKAAVFLIFGEQKGLPSQG